MSKQIEEHFIYSVTFEDLKKLYLQEVLEKLYVQKKYEDKITIGKFLKEKFYPTAVRPLSLLKKETLQLFISLVFLLVIILMIANMVNPIFGAIPNQVDSLKTNKRFSSEKLNEKESKKLKKTNETNAQRKTSQTQKQKEEKERDSDRSFFSFLKKKKKNLNNWWENKPLQRERVALFPIPLMPRGGYQLLNYEQMNMDPIFLMIHLHKIENLLILHLQKMHQLSKELNISQKNLLESRKKVNKLLKNSKRKNPILVLEKGFERFSGVFGFGIALRILTLTALEPLDSLNIFETNHGLVRNYQDFVPQIPVSKEVTVSDEVQLQVGNKILVFPKKVPKQLTELTGSTGSLEVPNRIKNKNVNEITPSVISRRQKLTLKRKKAKLVRLSDLPKIRQQSTTENIFSVSDRLETNRPSIRIRVQ